MKSSHNKPHISLSIHTCEHEQLTSTNIIKHFMSNDTCQIGLKFAKYANVIIVSIHIY